MMWDYFYVVVFVYLVFMIRKYLFDQYCKNEVFDLNRIVDEFYYNIPYHLMENI